VTGPPDPGTLWVVATPIGNLGDLSRRATEVLAEADLICCEDTRRTRTLLSATGIAAGPRLISLHAHNEHSRTPDVVAQLAAGHSVALVSDAGTPGVSDPGSHLVAAAAAAGLTVRPVPGPSSVLAALSVSGLPTARFCVEGFLPRKGPDRRDRVAQVAADPRTTVVLEAANRLVPTLVDLAAACGADRPAAVARELTKLHEEVWRGTLGDAAARFADTAARGEVVVVIAPAPAPDDPDDDQVTEAVRRHLQRGAGPRDAALAVAAELAVPRRRAYAAALAERDSRAT
jgi:16S rRNA (cytidine1402-2'-O)-methyltransferase